MGSQWEVAKWLNHVARFPFLFLREKRLLTFWLVVKTLREKRQKSPFFHGF